MLGPKIGPLFQSTLGSLLKSGLQPLASYRTHQETISRRPEQMYTPSDTRLEWPRKGPLFESDSNKRWGNKIRPLFESPPGSLVRYGTHQETISGRPEQMYTPSDPSLEWPVEGPLFKSG